MACVTRSSGLIAAFQLPVNRPAFCLSLPRDFTLDAVTRPFKLFTAVHGDHHLLVPVDLLHLGAALREFPRILWPVPLAGVAKFSSWRLLMAEASDENGKHSVVAKP